MRYFIIVLLLLASPVVAKDDWCSGSGQGPVDCPRHAGKPVRATITMKREPMPTRKCPEVRCGASPYSGHGH